MSIKKEYWPIILILISFVVLSCEKATVTNVARADVFIKSIIYQGDTLFGLAHSVFSFNGISQASVKFPSGDTLLLPDKEDGGISVFKNPVIDAGDYTKVLPAPGAYNYRIVYKDNTQVQVSNTLGSNFLIPAVIDSFALSSNGTSVVLKWKPVTGADGYQVRIVTGENEVVSAKRYSGSDPGRIEFPLSGFVPFIPGTFTVELDALLFESAAGQQLQALSVSSVSAELH